MNSQENRFLHFLKIFDKKIQDSINLNKSKLDNSPAKFLYKLDKRNFRKNILRTETLTPLEEKQQGVLHKPAQLFKRKLK